MATRKQAGKKSLYMVQEDLNYFRTKFRTDPNGGPPQITQDLVAEFIQYSNFVEENYNYNFVSKAFPQVFVPKRLKHNEP
ncbi:MAG TPA: hypothetical protein VEI97_12805 [bacterium]|nr:hypothetical protein [bacterium]